MATCFKPTTSNTLPPRIYVACLAAYNTGILHGTWIEVGQDAWAIWSSIQTMLATSPIAGAEEYAIHDYEGFGGVRIAEYTDLETLTQIAAFLAEHGTLGAAVLQHYCGDLDEACDALTERYCGCFQSVGDYMEEAVKEAMRVPDQLDWYIDWQAMGEDAERNGELTIVQIAHDEVHVFAGC